MVIKTVVKGITTQATKGLSIWQKSLHKNQHIITEYTKIYIKVKHIS